MSGKNISELLFENYLATQGLTFEFEKEFAGKSKRPDYSVPLDNREWLFEVKEFTADDIPTGGAFDPYAPIRAKIDAAKKKFKEYDGFPCCLVIYNNQAFVQTEKDFVIFGAMYGDHGFRMPFDPEKGIGVGPLQPMFFERGKMRRKEGVFNTRLSAIITLRQHPVGMRRFVQWWKNVKANMKAGLITEEPEPDFDVGEERLGVIVWENLLADIPFPENTFIGPYDERWGVLEGYLDRKFKGAGIIDRE
jgi:hypothetical protein